MKKYPVKIEFSDENGKHIKGSTIELVNTRAAKLKKFGKIGDEINENEAENSSEVVVDLQGSEEVQKLLNEAIKSISVKDDEIEKLTTAHTEALQAKDDEIEKLTTAHTEALGVVETNISNISKALIGAKTLADYKGVSDSLVEAIEKDLEP
jgi:hypothetical protein